jgi:LPXTG-motif cell wall-anchored protein
MLGTTSLKRLAAATLVGGALAVSPVMMPAASAAPSCPAYAGTISTTTTLSVSPSNPAQGSSFTATATVTNDSTGAPVSGGTVDFKYKNQRANDVAVVGGEASTTFTAGPGRGQVKASYSGVCVGGVAAVDSSSDGFVLGTEASSGGNGNGRAGTNLAGVGAGSGSGTGGLAATGVDTQTELLGAVGLGLLTVGGLSLVVHRRRVQA